jgi:RND family efflux transporter MFP subunit
MEIPRVKYPKGSSLLAVLILMIGGATAALLMAQEEEVALPVTESSVRSVDTLAVRKGHYRIQVPAWGFIEPCDLIDIRTEIGGRVAGVSGSVFAGGKVAEGAILFSLDAGTYQNALAAAMAVHEQARQAMAIEKGHQAIARAEWQLLEKSQWQGKHNEALALREPQMRASEAEMQIAAARQAQAALDVARTRVTAPCTGVILSEDLAIGQVLATGDAVLELACTDRYFITAAFPAQYDLDTAAIATATAGADVGATAGADVDPKAVAFQVGTKRYTGVVKAVLPQIDPETRQKRALVAFTGQEVLLGAYVGLTLPGPSFEAVVVLPREALRPDSTVWVLDVADTLAIRKVEVLALDPLHAVIGDGLEAGERVIFSHIANPLEGLPLRTTTPPAVGRSHNPLDKGGRP